MSASSPPTPEEALSSESNTSSPVSSSQGGARLAQSMSTPLLGANCNDETDDASSDAIIMASSLSPSTTKNLQQKHSTLRNSASLASHLKRLISNSSPISTNNSNISTNHSSSNALATAFDSRILNKPLMASSSKLDDCLMRKGAATKSNTDNNTNSALLNKLGGRSTSSAQNILLTSAVMSNADSKNASGTAKSKAMSTQDALAKLMHSTSGMSASKGNQKQATANTSNSKTSGATNGSTTNSSGGEVRRQRRPFKQSTVWDHFLKLSDGNVQCVHCAKILKRKDSSTKTMWGHLRAIHFKGRDWTALQQQAQSGRSLVVNEATVTNVDDNNSIYTDSSLGASAQTAQSWLEEQLGISSTCSPSNDENNQLDLLRTNESSNATADLSDLEASDITNIAVHKRLSDIYYNNETPTQPYVKRNRPTSYSPNTTTTSSSTDLFLNSSSKLSSSSTNGCLAAVRAALAGQQKNVVDDKKTMNFLAMIPRSSEVINITAGFSGEEDAIAANSNECNRNIDENGDECGNDLLPRAADTLSMDGSSSSSTTNNNTNANNNSNNNSNNANTNHLSAAALLSAAASNPFMYMAAANAISSVNGLNSTNKMSASFSLMDSECVLTLMRVAAELDCTFLFHCRDGQAHFCFEANDTAVERLRGPELSLVDLGNEVKITECNGGIEIESETWKKTDWTQFTWAIRGKCQKVLLKR